MLIAINNIRKSWPRKKKTYRNKQGWLVHVLRIKCIVFNGRENGLSEHVSCLGPGTRPAPQGEAPEAHPVAGSGGNERNIWENAEIACLGEPRAHSMPLYNSLLILRRGRRGALLPINAVLVAGRCPCWPGPDTPVISAPGAATGK